MLVSTEAIVLTSRKYRESSRLVTLYTEKFGKCTIVAPRAMQKKSRTGSALEPLRCSFVTFYKKTNRTLYTLSKAETVLSLRGVLESYEKIAVGFALLEAIYRTQTEEEPNPPLYHVLRSVLSALEQMHSDNVVALYFWTLFHISRLSGFGIHLPDRGNPLKLFELSPDYYEEMGRKEEMRNRTYFAIDLGCFVPSATLSAFTIQLSDEAAYFLQQCATIAPEHYEKLPVITTGMKKQLLHLFDRFYRYHFGVSPVSDVSLQMLQE